MLNFEYIIVTAGLTGAAFAMGYHQGVRSLFQDAVRNAHFRGAIAIAMAFFTVARRDNESKEIFDAARKLLNDLPEDNERRAIGIIARQLLYKLQVHEVTHPLSAGEEEE